MSFGDAAAQAGDNRYGAMAAFSFHPVKTLTTGEGGMVTTDNDGVAERIRRSRLHGMSRDAWGRYLPGGSWRYTRPDAGYRATIANGAPTYLDGKSTEARSGQMVGLTAAP